MQKAEIRDVAIIINDDSHLKDLYDKGPTCLIPLVNVPIIHYLMIKLLNGKMKNFIIFCGKYRKLIRNFFKDACYQDYVSYKIKFEFIGEENIENEGDAIRYLDNIKFQNEFLLLHGDVFIDYDIQELINTYKNVKKSNSAVIMSMVVGLNQNKFAKQCNWIKIDDKSIISSNGTTFSHPTDPQVYICSQDALVRLQEVGIDTIYNFIDNLIVMGEIMNDVVHVIPVSKLCLRLNTINAFFDVSFRIIRGTVHLCSPKNIFGDNMRVVRSSNQIISSHQSSYVSSSYPKYFMPCNSRLIGNVQIESGCSIGDNSRFFDTIIGKNCIIGNNVILKNCVLMDNVIIEDNCLSTYTFFGKFSKIGSHSQVVKSVVQYNSIIEKNTKIHMQYFSEDNRSNIWDAQIIVDFIPELSIINVVPEEITDEFENEIFEILDQAFEDSIAVEDLIVDIEKLRLSHGKTKEYLYVDVCSAFVKYPLKNVDTYVKKIYDIFNNYGEVLSSLISSDDEKKKLCLEAVQENACINNVILDNIAHILYTMFENDVVEKDDIHEWYDTSLVEDVEDEANVSIIKTNLVKFMEFLEKEIVSD